MLREMIENVSGTATRARAADCDTIVWTRLRLTQTGLMTANVQNAPTVRTVSTQRSALPRAATASFIVLPDAADDRPRRRAGGPHRSSLAGGSAERRGSSGS